MDSGNSGSLQSSSGGDEEYDSRAADSVSAFLSGGPISNPPPQPPPFLDPLSNYLHLHQNINSSLLNPNMAWPRSALRSDTNPITQDMINPMFSSSPPFMPSFHPPAAVGVDNNNPSVAPPPQNQNHAAARNPKKRSRASRRAPTTVLTTDTTNFRAMVQEFTGIPAPPFNSSSFPRSRLDLFGTRSTTFDSAQPPPYLRRPFAQKVQTPLPFLASSSSLSSSLLSPTGAIAASSTTNNNITSVSSISSPASSSTPSINYQLPITQSSNLFNIPNPLLTSLLQTNPKFPFSNSSVVGSKSQVSFEIPLNEFGLGHGNHFTDTLNGIPSLISSDQISLRNVRNDDTGNNNAASWNNNPVSPDGDNDDRVHVRHINDGNYEFPRHTTNGKMNYSASSTSNFHGEKGPENVATRGEGMMESWICSSE